MPAFGRSRGRGETIATALEIAQTVTIACAAVLISCTTSCRWETIATWLDATSTVVAFMRLARLDEEACQQLLAEKGVAGCLPVQTRLIETYAGNPLALKIVAQTIVDLYDGLIAPFLEQGEIIFGGVRTLLDKQYARLSMLEQNVLLWLAILREPVDPKELLTVLGTPVPRAAVLEALEELRSRSLIERGQRSGSFTLHPVVLEFTIERLIAETSHEIQQCQLSRLIEHGLTLAGSREYVRQTQMRLIVEPLLVQLRSMYPERSELENQLLKLLKRLCTLADYAQGYGPANVLALLYTQRGQHLSGFVSRYPSTTQQSIGHHPGTVNPC